MRRVKAVHQAQRDEEADLIAYRAMPTGYVAIRDYGAGKFGTWLAR